MKYMRINLACKILKKMEDLQPQLGSQSEIFYSRKNYTTFNTINRLPAVQTIFPTQRTTTLQWSSPCFLSKDPNTSTTISICNSTVHACRRACVKPTSRAKTQLLTQHKKNKKSTLEQVLLKLGLCHNPPTSLECHTRDKYDKITKTQMP